MTGAASVAAVLLSAVFAWAALAKALRRAPTAAAFAELGVPAPGVLAVLVPAGEAVVAALLVLRPDVGAALALAALAAFTLVVVRALSRGAAGGCGCFGSRRAEPVSPADVVRNGFLAAFAAVATGTNHLVRPGVPAVLAMVAVVAAAAGGQVVARRALGRPRGPARA